MENNENRPKRPRISRSNSSYGNNHGHDSERHFSENRKPYGHSDGNSSDRPYHKGGERKSYSSEGHPSYGKQRHSADGERPYRREGGYQGREGGYQKRDGGYQSREGGYQKREGGYQSREGGYQKRDGGYQGREGGYQKRDGGYQSREGGYQKREGGYQSREGGYQKRDGGYQKREGGYQRRDGRSGKYGSKPYAHEDEQASEGINRMIDARNSSYKYSDNDNVKVPVKEVVRLNKFIANSGVCSRREADTYIQAGVVTVNGEVVTELGSKVNVYTDDIRFNGERLQGEDKVYIVMNKPKGYVTTAGDPHADKTVMELLKGCDARVFPVGRLDKNTTGVLMFTNDGEIAEKLTHPSYDKKKIYQVSLDSDLKKEDYDKMMQGLVLTDGEIAADDLQYIDSEDKRKVGIEIHSGKNRIVRRMFESLGYEVKALDRVYFASLTKKGLKRGEWRYLTEGEVNILKIGAYR